MPIRNSDIRFVDGDIVSVVEAIKKYLPDMGYKIDYEKITENCADIRARNLQQSIFKLYLTNVPQIVHYNLQRKSDEQIHIEITCDLFRKFRIFYYLCLGLLLTGCSVFMALCSTYTFDSINSLALLDLFQAYGLTVLMAFLFFLSFVFFYMRSISTFPYENFVNLFYELLIEKGITNRNDIQIGLSFPDMWKVLLLLGLFVFGNILFWGIDSSIFQYSFIGFFLGGALTTLGVLIILLYIMYSRPSIRARMFFALMGFSLCVPIVFYNSPPIILSVTGDIELLFRELNGTEYSQQVMFLGSVIYVVALIVIFVIAGASLANFIQLPVRLVMQSNKFSTIHPDSLYSQSLQPENTSYLFNFILVLLWCVFLAVKLFGLYFAFTIFERTIFGQNYLFNSELAILFLENTKIVSTVLLQSKIGISATLLFHKILMLIYSSPMIIFLLLVLKKNLKSTREEYSLLSPQSDKYKKIKNQLLEKSKKICKLAGVRLPIIRVIDSPNIIAETKYLGFPVFKNILVVSEGAWNELSSKEKELDVLLAHEIWHIKKHSLARRILCFISDYSLFGNGFLALLQNSFQIEKEADDFAIKWIARKHKNKDMAIGLLKSLLERIEETAWINTNLQSSASLNFSMFKQDSYRSDFLKKFNESSKIQKAIINLKLFYQIYFGNEIQSYFHPSTSQRIAWAQEKYRTYEAN